MHEIAELKEWMDRLSQIDWKECDINNVLSVTHYLKCIQYLSLDLYPEYVSHEFGYHTDRIGRIFEGKHLIEEYEDIMEEFSACSSSICSFLLPYYEKSPYWEVSYIELYKDDYEYDKDKQVTQHLEKYSDCFEGKLMDSLDEKTVKEHPLYGFYELFDTSDNGVVDCGILLSSRLLPSYKKKERMLKRKYPQICAMIKRAEECMKHWMAGPSITIWEPEFEKAYYFGCDGSSDYHLYGYAGGMMSSDISILVAGELIDTAILFLNEKEAILPWEVANERRRVEHGIS